MGYQLLARVKLLVIKLLQNFKQIKRKNYHNKNKNLREEIKKLVGKTVNEYFFSSNVFKL